MWGEGVCVCADSIYPVLYNICTFLPSYVQILDILHVLTFIDFRRKRADKKSKSSDLHIKSCCCLLDNF